LGLIHPQFFLFSEKIVGDVSGHIRCLKVTRDPTVASIDQSEFSVSNIEVS
jgi:hypothetical protein